MPATPSRLYRLHVGHFPRPTATLPAGGKFGDHVKVRWIGDVMGETTTEVDLPGHADRTFGLLAHDATGSAPYPNAFRLSPFGNTIESEPNDTHDTATPFTPPVALNGVIDKPGDVDSYTFKATKGERYDVRVFARGIRSPLDPVLNIFGKNAGRVASNDDSGGPDSYLRFTAARDGDFVISVADHLKKGGPDYTYRVEISPVTPRLELSTPNESLRRGTNVMAAAIPRGNRQAILIQARREDFSGAISLIADSLPAGVTVEADEMSAGNSVIPVLFRADAKAPIGAALANITGKPTDTSTQVPCEFSSTAELVLGQNNVPFWTRTVDSLAVAVTEEAPFTVEIVEPKVPIVRGGSMDLKVVAKRKAGFTAPIAVTLPWNPPGIASKNENVIPENQNEATIPINASGGAELKTWRIVVNGTYTEPPPAPPAGATQAQRRRNRGGRLVVSSEFARLTVAPQFLTPEVRGGQRRTGERSRPEREGEQGDRLRRRSENDAHRAAQQGHDLAGDDHQGHDRSGVPLEDRRQDSTGRDEEPVLPGAGDAKRRADPAQPGLRPPARRRTARQEKAHQLPLLATGSSRAIPSPSRSIPTSHSAACRSSGSRAGKELKAAMRQVKRGDYHRTHSRCCVA